MDARGDLLNRLRKEKKVVALPLDEAEERVAELSGADDPERFSTGSSVKNFDPHEGQRTFIPAAFPGSRSICPQVQHSVMLSIWV